jgi:hypothetical protein
MRTLYESRLDGTVDAGSIGIGERVDVRTKMGVPVSTGDVIASNTFGIVLKDGNFYKRDLYLFAPIVEKTEVEIQNALYGMTPDERAYHKMLKMGIIEADEAPDKELEVTPEPAKKTDKKDDKKEKVFDPAKLPDDIKKSIESSSRISTSQADNILSAIGETTIKSLKTENVPEDDIYALVLKIRNVVKEVLVGKDNVSK